MGIKIRRSDLFAYLAQFGKGFHAHSQFLQLVMDNSQQAGGCVADQVANSKDLSNLMTKLMDVSLDLLDTLAEVGPDLSTVGRQLREAGDAIVETRPVVWPELRSYRREYGDSLLSLSRDAEYRAEYPRPHERRSGQERRNSARYQGNVGRRVSDRPQHRLA